MKKRVLIMCPEPGDATSFYRGMGPFFELEHVMEDFEFYYPREAFVYDWTTYSKMDVIFFQRPMMPEHFRLIKEGKDFGVKIWIDHDDNLLEIPESNPAHQKHSRPENRKALMDCMRAADLVTVSTDALKLSDKKFHVVPNAFNERFCKRLESVPAQKEKVILWRGTPSHQEDLLHYAPDIIKFKQENPDWTFCFFGFNPWFLKKHMKFEVIPFCDDLNSYFQIIQEIQPKIQMVTLQNTAFNRAKSNIAWIEGTFAGAVTLAPADMDEWNRPGIIPYENLQAGLEFATKKADLVQEHMLSNDYIQEHLLLSSVNKKREVLLRDLTAPA